MPSHIQIPGCAYYITIVIYRRLRVFTRPAYVLPLLDSLNFYRYQHTSNSSAMSSCRTICIC
jgi:hypothetical protein